MISSNLIKSLLTCRLGREALLPVVGLFWKMCFCFFVCWSKISYQNNSELFQLFCRNIHQNRSLYQQMLFTIPEQKKIAKFFQCLDELLQPHIISVSEDNTDYNYIRIPAQDQPCGHWQDSEPELDDGQSFTTKHFISYNFHSLPRPAGSRSGTTGSSSMCEVWCESDCLFVCRLAGPGRAGTQWVLRWQKTLPFSENWEL